MTKVKLPKVRILRNKFKTIIGIEVNDKRMFADKVSIEGVSGSLSKVNLTIPTNDVDFLDINTESLVLPPQKSEVEV